MIYLYNPRTENHLFIIQMIINQLKYYKYNVCEIKSLDYNINNSNDIYIIFLNFYYLFNDLTIQKDFQFICNQKYKVLYLTEPINFLIDKNLYITQIRKLKPNIIFSYSKENCVVLKNYFNISRCYPLHHEYINMTDNTLNELYKKDNTNALFIGKINDYRKKFIINSEYNYIKVIDNIWLKDEWKHILKNNLFYINIHRRKNCKCLEMMRIYPILYNGGVIISSNVNKDEKEEFKNYNIYFCEKDEDIYNTFLKIKENIDYNSIKTKTELFRKHKNNDINKIISYLNLLHF